MAYIVKQNVGNGRINIHLAENHYIPGKGARQIRTYIGTLDPNTNELLLGARNKEPNVLVLELLKEKGIAYNGKRARVPGRPCKKEAKIPSRKLSNILEKAEIAEIGRAEAFCYLAETAKLSEAIVSSYGEDLGAHILAMATFQATEGTPFYLASEWASETGKTQLALSSASISRTLEAVGEAINLRDIFFSKWIDYCGRPSALIHDTTSISSYSEENDSVEWGYNRDKEQLPQINVAMVVARESKLPIWYRVLPGSIPDVSSLKLTTRMLKSLGLRDFSFSLDRGYFSSSNIAAMLNDGMDFAIGVPLSSTQVHESVSTALQRMLSAEASFLYQDQRLRYASAIYRISIGNDEEKKLPLHLFLDPLRRETQAQSLEKALLEMEHLGQQTSFNCEGDARKWLADHAKNLSGLFEVKQMGGKNWVVLRNITAITKEFEHMGLTIILTSRNKQSPEEVVATYRSRDLVEKIFCTLKNGVGASRLHSWNNTQMHARLFVAFVATILRQLLEIKLREKKLLKKYSVDEALAILKKVKTARLADGTVVHLEIPRKARIVREAIGLC